MSRSTLRTITNINIDGQALDATETHTLSFKVNCDSLSWISFSEYDNTAGTHRTWHYPRGGQMIAKHNGEYFSGSFGGNVPGLEYYLGHDYTEVPTIFQNYPESVEHPENTGPGKYDVLLGSGRIQQDATAATEVNIGKDITSIIPAVYYGEEPNRRLIGGCMLEIGGVQTLISSYSKNTGIATLESDVTVTAGTPFRLISNYLECEPFFWYCRSDPEVTITAEYDGTSYQGVKVEGTYEQDEDVAMQWYRFSYNNEQGDKSFSYTFTDLFPTPWRTAPLAVSCTVMTQENKSVQVSAVPGSPPFRGSASISAEEDITTRTVRITGSNDFSIPLFIWRAEGTFTDAESIGNAVLVGILGHGSYLDDCFAESGKNYTYIAASVLTDPAVCTITVTSRRVKISKLREGERSYHRRKFSIIGSMYFDINSEQSDTDRVLGTQLIGTQTGQPLPIYDETEYESGSLTVFADQLGDISEPIIDGIGRQSALDSFLSYKGPFLMLDNAGTARIVTVTSLSRARDHKTGMTAYTIGWAEICRTGEAMI